jgi:hypothetical protein
LDCVTGLYLFSIKARRHPEQRVNSLSLDNKSEKLLDCSFFPAGPDYLLVVTSHTSFIDALKDSLTIPFLSIPNVRFVDLTAGCGSYVIVVRVTDSNYKILHRNDAGFAEFQSRHCAWLALKSKFSPSGKTHSS